MTDQITEKKPLIEQLTLEGNVSADVKKQLDQANLVLSTLFDIEKQIDSDSTDAKSVSYTLSHEASDYIADKLNAVSKKLLTSKHYQTDQIIQHPFSIVPNLCGLAKSSKCTTTKVVIYNLVKLTTTLFFSGFQCIGAYTGSAEGGFSVAKSISMSKLGFVSSQFVIKNRDAIKHMCGYIGCVVNGFVSLYYSQDTFDKGYEFLKKPYCPTLIQIVSLLAAAGANVVFSVLNFSTLASGEHKTAKDITLGTISGLSGFLLGTITSSAGWRTSLGMLKQNYKKLKDVRIRNQYLKGKDLEDGNKLANQCYREFLASLGLIVTKLQQSDLTIWKRPLWKVKRYEKALAISYEKQNIPDRIDQKTKDIIKSFQANILGCHQSEIQKRSAIFECEAKSFLFARSFFITGAPIIAGTMGALSLMLLAISPNPYIFKNSMNDVVGKSTVDNYTSGFMVVGGFLGFLASGLVGEFCYKTVYGFFSSLYNYIALPLLNLVSCEYSPNQLFWSAADKMQRRFNYLVQLKNIGTNFLNMSLLEFGIEYMIRPIWNAVVYVLGSICACIATVNTPYWTYVAFEFYLQGLGGKSTLASLMAIGSYFGYIKINLDNVQNVLRLPNAKERVSKYYFELMEVFQALQRDTKLREMMLQCADTDPYETEGEDADSESQQQLRRNAMNILFEGGMPLAPSKSDHNGYEQLQ